MTALREDSARDSRIDFFRGLALLFIFVDHVPDNVPAKFTMRVFGFSDAAELFVLLAGFSAVLAYGRYLDDSRPSHGLARIGWRVRDIYLWHLAVLVIATAGLFAHSFALGHDRYIQMMGLEAFQDDAASALARAALLLLQPNLMNILPLYVILLAVFPLIYWFLRRDMRIAVAASGALWLASGTLGINMPASDGNGWFFNPFAWQFLFTIGAAASIAVANGRIRSVPLLFWACMVYIAYAFILYAPWTQIPGLQTSRLLDLEAFGFPDKTNLSAWRLTHILALGYIVLTLVPKQAVWLQSPWAQWLSLCGRHSLEVFSVGIVSAIAAGVVVYEFGSGYVVLVLVNALGMSAMSATAWLCARCKTRASNNVEPTLKIGSAAPTAARAELPTAPPR